MVQQDFEAETKILKDSGFRVTKGRVMLLSILRNTHSPFTANALHKKLQGKIDKVTLYRALEDFVEVNIVTKVNLMEGVMHYEFSHHDHHHHHIVCEKCGKIEDIESCDQQRLQKETLAHSQYFKIINSHSLEFFGICNACCKK